MGNETVKRRKILKYPKCEKCNLLNQLCMIEPDDCLGKYDSCECDRTIVKCKCEEHCKLISK